MSTRHASDAMDADPGALPALARARAAALAELRAHSRGISPSPSRSRSPSPSPSPSWRRQATGVALTVLASTALALEVGSLLSIVDLDRLGRRALPITLLLVVQIVGVWLAIAPGRRLARFGAVMLAAAAAAAVVGWRGSSEGGGAAAGSPFTCSLSHLAVDARW